MSSQTEEESPAQGVCNCTDCGGPDSITLCFWDIYPFVQQSVSDDNQSGEFFSAKEEDSDDGTAGTESKGRGILKGLQKTLLRTKSKDKELQDQRVISPPRSRSSSASKKRLLRKKRTNKDDPGIETDYQARLEELEAENKRLQEELAAKTDRISQLERYGQGQALHQLESHRARCIGLLDSMTNAMAKLTVSKSRCASVLPTKWTGQGSPYLLHLSTAATVILPYLVQQLQETVLRAKGSLVLVGAAAWNAYTLTPLNTEDLDFSVNINVSKLKDLLDEVVSVLLELPSIRSSLARLQRISTVPQQSDMSDQGRADYAKAIGDVENDTSDLPTSILRNMVRIVRSDSGYRVQVGHKTLVDISPSSEKDQQYLKDYNVQTCQLSYLLPNRLVHHYHAPFDPIVQVAPVPLLQSHIQISLSSGLSWRLQKDAFRLRLLTQEATIQLLSGRGHLAQFISQWDTILAQFDPAWMATMLQLRRILENTLDVADGGLLTSPSSTRSSEANSPEPRGGPSCVGMERIRRHPSKSSIDSISLTSLNMDDHRVATHTTGSNSSNQSNHHVQHENQMSHSPSQQPYFAAPVSTPQQHVQYYAISPYAQYGTSPQYGYGAPMMMVPTSYVYQQQQQQSDRGRPMQRTASQGSISSVNSSSTTDPRNWQRIPTSSRRQQQYQSSTWQSSTPP